MPMKYLCEKRDEKIVHLTQHNIELLEEHEDREAMLISYAPHLQTIDELKKKVSTLLDTQGELQDAKNVALDDVLGLKRDNQELNDTRLDQNVKFADLLNQLDEAGQRTEELQRVIDGQAVNFTAVQKDRDLWENRARNLRQWVSQTMRDKYREWK